MKKLLFFVLVLSLVFSLFACKEETCKEHKDIDEDGICDNCGKEMPDDGKNDPTLTDKLDVGALGYTVVHNAYQPKQRRLAEDFVADFQAATGIKLEIEPHTSEDSEYEIQFGKLDDRKESSEALKAINSVITSGVSGYSIVVKGNVIVVIATNDSLLEEAADKLISLIENNKLLLDKDFEETKISYKSGNETVYVDMKDFAASALLSSLNVDGKALSGFSSELKGYSAFYPSTEYYPTVTAAPLNAKATVSIVQAQDNSGEAKITVKSQDNSKEEVYIVKFTHAEEVGIISEIVNKNGVSGIVSFVFDDGLQRTADVLSTRLLPKYKDIVVSYAIITDKLATVGELVGNQYELTPTKYNKGLSLPDSYFDEIYNYTYEFWNEAVAFREGNELLSHSHTHTDKAFLDPYFELKVSQEILERLCNQKSLTYINPGISNPDNLDTSSYNDLRVNSGLYIGARGSGSYKVVTAPWLKAEFKNRFNVYSLSVKHYLTNRDSSGDFATNETSTKEECLAEGISYWTNYIDNAVSEGGWAPFCIHNVIPKGETSTAKWHIYEEQMDALLAYAQKLVDEGKICVMNYTDAQIYYNQMACAELTTTLEGNESVTVSLSIPDTEPQKAYLTMEMTVKVPVPMTWTAASFTYGDNTGDLDVFENQDGTKYVYVDIAPGAEALVITEG